MSATIELQKKISEEFVRGNFDFSSTHMADDARWNILGTAPIIGRERIAEAFKMEQLQSFPLVKIKTIIAEGQYVVTESTGEAKAKNGKPYNQSYCEVFRFADGQLQEITTYLDTALSRDVLSD